MPEQNCFTYSHFTVPFNIKLVPYSNYYLSQKNLAVYVCTLTSESICQFPNPSPQIEIMS